MNAGKEIYIVSGERGEYSDHSEWLVAAFTNKAVAENFVTILRIKLSEAIESNQQTELIHADRYGEWLAGRLYSPPDRPPLIAHLAEDPSGWVADGVSYGVVPVPLNPAYEWVAK